MLAAAAAVAVVAPLTSVGIALPPKSFPHATNLGGGAVGVSVVLVDMGLRVVTSGEQPNNNEPVTVIRRRFHRGHLAKLMAGAIGSWWRVGHGQGHVHGG